jgi:hypothetical protein
MLVLAIKLSKNKKTDTYVSAKKQQHPTTTAQPTGKPAQEQAK